MRVSGCGGGWRVSVGVVGRGRQTEERGGEDGDYIYDAALAAGCGGGVAAGVMIYIIINTGTVTGTGDEDAGGERRTPERNTAFQLERLGNRQRFARSRSSRSMPSTRASDDSPACPPRASPDPDRRDAPIHTASSCRPHHHRTCHSPPLSSNSNTAARVSPSVALASASRPA
ncbi:hypothetical protein PYCCODRAFT_456433 [Trametes coccinea BRFM310]|uniref:Uncharacterized protein n=1 Tax=Trametes coccinea (strain BRFM310) TaxID=1353009 RepID=A0A1Y2INU6_TRAC3|nr:hypothetical protein PYCCODRAFT_456433 [Trametes coccinea BRFM310]